MSTLLSVFLSVLEVEMFLLVLVVAIVLLILMFYLELLQDMVLLIPGVASLYRTGGLLMNPVIITFFHAATNLEFFYSSGYKWPFGSGCSYP